MDGFPCAILMWLSFNVTIRRFIYMGTIGKELAVNVKGHQDN